MLEIFFFFFSSRRRHTRCGRDWSSDVCSSDLGHVLVADAEGAAERPPRRPLLVHERLGPGGPAGRDRHPAAGQRVLPELPGVHRLGRRDGAVAPPAAVRRRASAHGIPSWSSSVAAGSLPPAARPACRQEPAGGPTRTRRPAPCQLSGRHVHRRTRLTSAQDAIGASLWAELAPSRPSILSPASSTGPTDRSRQPEDRRDRYVKILVTVKRVPDTAAEKRLDPDDKTLDRES